MDRLTDERRALAERWIPRALAEARRQASPAALADVRSECLWRLCMAAAAHDGRAEFAAYLDYWLRCAATRAAVARLPAGAKMAIRQGRLGALPRSLPLDAASPVVERSDFVAAADADDAFEAMLALAAEADRPLLRALYVEGHSVNGWAGRVGRSRSSVQRQHDRVLARLRNQLERSSCPRSA